eukprot:7498735-Alexandrium_andersonii.AAC.1
MDLDSPGVPSALDGDLADVSRDRLADGFSEAFAPVPWCWVHEWVPTLTNVPPQCQLPMGEARVAVLREISVAGSLADPAREEQAWK